jgi:hypothetical protein
MSLKATSSNGVKVYNCTAGKSTPQWYEDALKKKTKGKQTRMRGDEGAHSSARAHRGAEPRVRTTAVDARRRMEADARDQQARVDMRRVNV